MSTVLFDQGTAIIWGHTGGAGVTDACDLNGLGPSGAAREGAAKDLGSTFAEWWSLYVWMETGTAPTADLSVDVWLNWSHDNSNWSGTSTGTNSSYTIGTNDANLRSIGRGSQSGNVLVTATGNTLFKAGPFPVRAMSQYVSPIVVNRLNQALRTQGTASDHASRVILVPLIPTF